MAMKPRKVKKKPVKKMRKGGLIENRKEIIKDGKRIGKKILDTRLQFSKDKGKKATFTGRDQLKATAIGGRQLKATKKPVKKKKRVAVDGPKIRRVAVDGPKLIEKGKGGAVKKMRGGGMVKKMRKGGAVRKKK